MNDHEKQTGAYEVIKAADEFVEYWEKNKHWLINIVDDINPFYSNEVGARVVNRKTTEMINDKIDSDIVDSLRKWPDPTPEMLGSAEFEAIWQCIKHWDINVPSVYAGYMGATGNHVRAILDALYMVRREGIS